jgi:enamine deaminase RidA (YjgF/YER057c/UK114 family)
MSVYEKLDALNITLPKMTAAWAAYVPYVRSGKMVFLSGHLAKAEGKLWSGKLGEDLTTEQGKTAARTTAIDLMGTLQAAVGDLNKVTRVLKLMVLVNCTPTFVEQHLVANGASELFEQVFGEKGRHVRCSFGVAQIPFGACVEIDLVAEVED